MSFWSKVIHAICIIGQVANVTAGAINPALLPPKYQIPVTAGLAAIQAITHLQAMPPIPPTK